jgi:predicted Fe-Mo cluster-binding NifX family protein
VEAEVTLRVRELEKAEATTQHIEAQIREAVPYVDRVLIHAEPMERTHLRYAVPLNDPGGAFSEHFGEALYFGLVTLRLADGAIEQQQVVANPHTELEKAKGIRVAEWLVAQKVDVVLLKQSLHGKGPTYVFGDAGVEMQETTATTLEEALAGFRRERVSVPGGEPPEVASRG